MLQTYHRHILAPKRCTRTSVRVVRTSAVENHIIDKDAAARAAWDGLASMAKVETSLVVRHTSQTSLGLVASAHQKRGDVLMRVPRSVAIVLDYDRGLSMPPARWPRLSGAVSPNVEPLPWDILLALALIDGLAGDGGEFWRGYCDALLPAPERLTLPMCWEPPRLAQLQHADIAAAAAAQQDRLAGLLPELMEPLAPDVPSWLQWGFACVRSRAFRAGPDAFAFVPFLDLANHAPAPAAPPAAASSSAPSCPAPPTANADFRLSPPDSGAGSDTSTSERTSSVSTSSSSGSSSGRGEFFELIALRDIAPGEEVSICYSGAEGYTNQRFMAQYGFVPAGGNTADRVKLELGPELQSAPLDLTRLQDLLGDTLFLSALRGSDPYLFAALKSLPLVDREAPTAGEAAGGGGDPWVSGSLRGSSGGAAASRDASVCTARALLRQVQAQMAEGTTSLEADEEALYGRGGSEKLLEADPRLAAALSYRIERKRLLAKTEALLKAYDRGASAVA